MMEYTIEKGSGSLTWIYITAPNLKEETLTIELSECKNPGGRNALPYLWYKAGYTDKILDTYLCIHTYCTDSEGNCYGRYNPQTKKSEDGKRHELFGISAPIGSVVITNRKSFKQKDYRKALLIY